MQTAIDISIVSPRLETILQWTVSTSPGDSDHCPIIISMMDDRRAEVPTEYRWDFKKAIWSYFRSSRAWEGVPEDLELIDNNDLLRDLYHRFQGAAEDSIPRYKVTKFFPKPWWTMK